MVPVAIIKSLGNLISGKLTFPKFNLNKTIRMDDGLQFKIFRHMKLAFKNNSTETAVFIVRFKFKRFSHPTNIRLSCIPMFMIAGFPGFHDKIWMIDWETGYWQGVYQWESMQAIEKYKQSFVLGMMNKRAIASSVSYHILLNTDLKNFIQMHENT